MHWVILGQPLTLEDRRQEGSEETQHVKTQMAGRAMGQWGRAGSRCMYYPATR